MVELHPLVAARLAAYEPLNETEFYALKPRERRVQLALDALVMLKHGSCLSLALRDTYARFFLPDYQNGQELQPLLQQLKPQSCTVCAQGALFLTKVLKYNQCRSLGQSRGNDDTGTHRVSPGLIAHQLRGTFTLKQLQLIENAFEGGRMADRTPQGERAACMYSEPYAEDRMIRILENLILNDGTFVVPKTKA